MMVVAVVLAIIPLSVVLIATVILKCNKTAPVEVAYCWIFTRDSIYAIACICHANSVCLSVRLSVTRVICVKTAEHVEIISPSDRPIIIVFRHQGSLRKSDGFTPNGGAEYKG